jgi:hypothetical protein
MEIEHVEQTERTVSGKRLTVGGVTVTVELNEGELDIRVGACDDADGEGPTVDLDPMDGTGHGNIYVAGPGAGKTSHDRFVIRRKTVFN